MPFSGSTKYEGGCAGQWKYGKATMAGE